MPTGDSDAEDLPPEDLPPEDLPPGWDQGPEEGTVVGPSGDREPEPEPGDIPDARRAEEHREQAERLEGGTVDDDDEQRGGDEDGIGRA